MLKKCGHFSYLIVADVFFFHLIALMFVTKEDCESAVAGKYLTYITDNKIVF